MLLNVTLLATAWATALMWMVSGTTVEADLKLVGTTVTFQGRGGYSADGLGQLTPGGTIQAQVPPGSAVRQALLYGAVNDKNSGPTIEVVLDSTRVVLTNLNSEQAYTSSYRADVTAQVAAKVGSGSGAPINFTVNSDFLTLDGVALVVIYSNPDLPEVSIYVFDGGLSSFLSTTTIPHQFPINKSLPGFSATLALGISFSGQSYVVAGHTCGNDLGQWTRVDVNGKRLTSCAGNYDDAREEGANGNLITVGGVGDSVNNPTDPFQTANDGKLPRVEDDELYDIAPFLSTGQTQTVLTTENPSTTGFPSGDDQVFLAILKVRSSSARPVVTSVTPNSGPATGGTKITIAGFDFDPGATVTIGGEVATNVVVASPISITATTPAGVPGPRAVTVSNFNGRSGTLNNAFLYTCTYSVSPSTRQFTPAAGSDAVTVTTQPGCAWTPGSNVSWLHPGAGGTGSGSFNYTVDVNPDPVVRIGQINVQGNILEVTQLAATTTARQAGGTSPALSANGRFLAYASANSGIVPNDTNQVSDVFVLDRATGQTVRVSVADRREQANGPSFAPAISASGRFVVFESDATNLLQNDVSKDTNGVRDVFLHDRDADGDGVFDELGAVLTMLVSRSSSTTLVNNDIVDGAPGRGASRSPAINADGSVIAFASEADNLVFNDTNKLPDIFIVSRQVVDQLVNGVLVSRTKLTVGRGNVSTAGAQALGGGSDFPSLSGDGQLIVFESDATNLVLNDGNGARDVFLRNRQSGTTTRISETSDGQEAGGPSFGAAISQNGAMIAFTSSVAMVPEDGNGLPDVFLRPMSGGTTVRQSVGSDGQEGEGGSSGAALSADGQYVAFTSNAPNLSPFDGNGTDDVFVRNRFTGEVKLVSSSGAGSAAGRSFDPSISADGQTIAFSTAAAFASVRAADRIVSNVAAAEGEEDGIAVSSPAPTPDDVDGVAPTRGAAGTVVQIRLRKLFRVQEVLFGGTPGGGVQQSADGMMVTVTAPPSGAGTVNVDLASGISRFLAGRFTYDTAPACTYALSPQPPQVAAAGGAFQVNVATAGGCAWNVGTTVDWIGVTPASGAGPGAFVVTAQPHAERSERATTITVLGATLEVRQAGDEACTYAVPEPRNRTRELAASGGVDNGVEIDTQPGCGWGAAINYPPSGPTGWLRLSIPEGDRKGPATVLYEADPNPSAAIRTATLTVQGVDIAVTQLAPPPPTACSYTVTAPTFSFGPAGGQLMLNIATPAIAGGCPWNVRSDVNWLALAPTSSASGSDSGIVHFIVGSNTGLNRNGHVDVNGQSFTVTQDGPAGGQPFGAVDTPADGVTLAGSVALTGWALDDEKIAAIEIWGRLTSEPFAVRSCDPLKTPFPDVAPGFFIGTAPQVKGARPDVQSTYGALPYSDEAGWGYLMLSNQLPPSGGNGTYVLTFCARDVDDNVTLLGERTVTFDNLVSTIPFGAIDTPAQGEEIQGDAYAQFGWALTPLPNTIPFDGSTIAIYIDGTNIGSPTYNIPRSDIAALFPSLNNSAGPVGYRYLNTTVLADTVHTIAWVVTDDAGGASGMGSRYFSVRNNSVASVRAASKASAPEPGAVRDVPVAASGVQLAVGAGVPIWQPVAADAMGTRHVMLRALDLAQLSFGGASGGAWEGYVVNGASFEPLPIGSTFDGTHGTFAWQVGPGFIGVYELVFVDRAAGVRVPVRVVVQPEATAVAGRVHVDAPHAGETVTQPFTVGGWTVAGAALQMQDVFVYAYPVDGGAPLLVGQAAVGGARPDVAAAYGGQFARSGYTIGVDWLPAGTYDLLVVAQSGVSAALDAATWVRHVTVR